MVDIHSHILWGLDDGAKTIEESLEMLQIAADSGTTDIVATPHSNADFEFLPDQITARIDELNSRTGGRPVIHRGCDFHLSFDNIVGAIEDPGRYSINSHRYLLVEFSDLQISASLDTVLQRLLDASLVPIVTHPERNPVLRKEPQKLDRWIEEGCLVQVTALSLMGGFGKSAKNAADRLMQRGHVHVIASDAHDPEHRHPRLDGAFEQVSREYGKDMAESLLVRNPASIIRGEAFLPDVSSSGVMEEQKKWWQFWRTKNEFED